MRGLKAALFVAMRDAADQFLWVRGAIADLFMFMLGLLIEARELDPAEREKP